MLSLISGDSAILRCSPLDIADQVALPKKLKSYVLLDALKQFWSFVVKCQGRNKPSISFPLLTTLQ